MPFSGRPCSRVRDSVSPPAMRYTPFSVVVVHGAPLVSSRKVKLGTGGSSRNERVGPLGMSFEGSPRPFTLEYVVSRLQHNALSVMKDCEFLVSPA
jgi:hypothetical protein